MSAFPDAFAGGAIGNIDFVKPVDACGLDNAEREAHFAGGAGGGDLADVGGIEPSEDDRPNRTIIPKSKRSIRATHHRGAGAPRTQVRGGSPRSPIGAWDG